RVSNATGTHLTAMGSDNNSDAYLALIAKYGASQKEWRVYHRGNAGGILSFYDATLAQNRMVIDSDGNVGIGDSTPAAKLTVDGAILRTGSTMYGSNANTHINLGTNSITGTDGEDTLFATVSGGIGNDANDNYATVGGGWDNTASGFSATVGGGRENTASDWGATVGGGEGNQAEREHATVSGGSGNTASGGNATVPGGFDNTASGWYSLAAGRGAKANHNGTFVWADTYNGHPASVDFSSTAIDQFLIRASGGVGIGTDNPEALLDVANPSSGAAMSIGRVSGEPSIVARSDASGGWVIMDSTGDGNLGLNYYDDGDIILAKGGGDVGIGTTSPTPNIRLEVDGAISAFRTGTAGIIKVDDKRASGGAWNLYSGQLTPGDFSINEDKAGNVARLYIEAGGIVGIGTITGDSNGNLGDIAWDDNYIFVKTSAGWKRTPMEAF
ncbi:MAG: hypothetical protein ACYS21_20880, partial [Planctomycetota bacterium]